VLLRHPAGVWFSATTRLEFLKQYHTELGALRTAPGVDDVRLDFPVTLRIDRKTVMAQFDFFPPELLSLAGAFGLGLEISIYPRDLLQLVRRARARRARAQKKSAAGS